MTRLLSRFVISSTSCLIFATSPAAWADSSSLCARLISPGPLTQLTADVGKVLSLKTAGGGNSKAPSFSTTGSLPPPTGPSGGHGFSGMVYLQSVTTNSRDNPTLGTMHAGANLGNSVSDTKVTFPTSIDIEYNGPSAPKIDAINFQTSLYSISYANGFSRSPVTLKTAANLGPGGSSSTALTFINLGFNKDYSIGKNTNFFVNPSINAVGPYYAQLQSDGSIQRGIRYYDVSGTTGIKMEKGRSTYVLTHTEGFTLSGTHGSDGDYHLLRDNTKTTRLTYRRNLTSYYMMYDVQSVAGQAKTADITFGVAKLLGSH